MTQDPGQLRHCVVSPPLVSDSGTPAGPMRLSLGLARTEEERGVLFLCQWLSWRDMSWSFQELALGGS